MAFSIEAAVTVPLSVAILFGGITYIPPTLNKYYSQAYCVVETINKQISSDQLFSTEEVIVRGEQLKVSLSSPQKMQELISYAIDLKSFGGLNNVKSITAFED